MYFDNFLWYEVPAIVGNGRVFATQFHPEKSGQLGMKILANFGQIVKEVARVENY